MANPYQSAEQLPPHLLVGRVDLVGVLCRRLHTHAPTFLTGDVRSGKSSVLHAVAAHLEAEGWRVSLLAGTHLERRLTRARFWEDALLPLRDLVAYPAVRHAHQQARAHEFSPDTLSALLRAAHEESLPVALLIDDLEALLRHPELGGVLLGELAHLADQRTIAILGTGQISLAALQARLAQRAPTHAAALSAWLALPVPPLPPPAVQSLLLRAGETFSPTDRAFLARAGGHHPYLLQLLAEPLWEQASAGIREPLRREQAGGRALAMVEWTIGAAWRSWDPAARWMVLRIALAQLDRAPPPLPAPTLADPASQALLETLIRLDPEELQLLLQTLLATLPSAAAAATAAATAASRRSSLLKALLQILIQHRLTATALEHVLDWRPDLAPCALLAAQRCGAHLSSTEALQHLQHRGAVRPTATRHLRLDADVLLWWLTDQLAPLARGDVDLPLWLRGQGLSPPNDSATAHLRWRLERLGGLLARGARPLIREAAA